jgi:hypothetical protein
LYCSLFPSTRVSTRRATRNHYPLERNPELSLSTRAHCRYGALKLRCNFGGVHSSYCQ